MNVFQPIHRLAIVNRGEAAMRCIRAVKALRTHERSELRVIALYTDVDRDTPFVRHADAVERLDAPRGEVAAYLDHDGLLEALRRAGADAVWPGWGFVAEDPVFADRLDAAGIRFLGPSGTAIRLLGDKIAAKQLAERSELVSFEADTLELAVGSESRALADKAYVDKLKAALADHFGRPLALTVKVGAVNGRSAAAIAESERRAREDSASARIDADPFVQELVAGFDATVESVKPVGEGTRS
jgi:acetyl/propionyl-CoA carboxylase alpha subunit